MTTITHKRGTTFSATFEVEQNDIPVNLTGYTIAMHIRPSPGSTTLSLDLTSDIEIHDAAGGLFRIVGVDIDLPARVYYYDQMFTKDGVTQKSDTYTFEIIQDVTR